MKPTRQTNRSVRRGAILTALKPHAATRFVIFMAPAGFGKSTTMSQWRDQLEASGRVTVWMSCEPDDNNEAAFLERFIQALRQAVKDPDELDRSHRSSPLLRPSAVLNAIAAGLAHDRGTSVFIDDYHLVESGAVRSFVEQFIRQAPPNVSFVMGSRDVPSLPLARLRVAGDLFEIGPDQLRFDLEETDAFLNGKLGLNVSPDAIDALCVRTEGWAAGLQLASLSIGPQRRPEIVAATLSGAHRNIADFLLTDVIAGLRPELVRFLLLSSVFERFDADACRAVLRERDAASIIGEIEAHNLFLVALDDERRWFRYHHLFRDFLRREFERREPDLIASLHLAAADWFGTTGMLAEAIRHALTAGDQGRAASLVENNGLDLIAQCQLVYVRQLLSLLPAQLVGQRVRLQLIVLWLAVHSSQPDAALRALATARRLLDSGPVDVSDPGTMAGTSIEVELEVLASAVHSTFEKYEEARDAALSALRRLAPDAWFMEGTAANVAGYNHYALGNLDEARRALASARNAHDRSGSLLGTTIATCYLAVVERSAACLPAAETLLRKAIAEARTKVGPNSYAEALAGTLLAELVYETDSSGEALSLVETLGPLIEGSVIILYPLASLPTYARALALNGRSEEALEMLGRIYETVRGTVYVRLASTLVHERIRLLLERGAILGARNCLDNHRAGGTSDGMDIANEFEFFAEARLLMAEGRHAEASSILDALLARTRSTGRRRRLILALILRAKSHHLDGRCHEALQYLVEALKLAQPSGFIRSFADEGLPMAEMLEALLAGSILEPPLHGYARKILSVTHKSRQFSETLREEIRPDRLYGLTTRELELLECLSDGLSNKEVATALSLSESTVKWHLKNIFGKLAVANRVQAVRAAQAVLQPHPKGGGRKIQTALL